jgi:hypothetical protein
MLMSQRQFNQRGTIDVQSLGFETLKSRARNTAITCEKELYRWRPPGQLAVEFPAGFAIDFEVNQDLEGRRRFNPLGGGWTLLAKAYYAGRILCSQRAEVSDEQEEQDSVLWHVFQRVQRMHEKLERRFQKFADLQIRSSGREHRQDRSVLPQGLGSTPAMPQTTWTFPEFIEQGRARASTAGMQRLNEQLQINYGLLAAAERNPLHDMHAEQSQALIRLALFNLDETTDVSPEIIDCVFNRLTEAIRRHKNDTRQDYEKWFHGNLFKSLANQAGDDMGKLTTEQVKAVILEIGWPAYQHVAEMIQVFCETFVNDLPKKLTTTEQELFASCFYRQDYFGGLPLIMFLDRSDLIQPIIVQMWEAPQNTTYRGVFWRLLTYYSEMATKRRRADNRSKQQGPTNRVVFLDSELNTNQDPAKTPSSPLNFIPEQDARENLANWDQLLETINLTCHHPGCTGKLGLKDYQYLKATIKLELVCEYHGSLPTQVISRVLITQANPFES